MTVKIKLQIYLIFLSFFVILIKFFFNDLSIGKIWFYVDGNSLVGLQSFSEKISSSYILGNYFYELVIFILELNLFFFLGVIFILISFLLLF